MLAPLQDRLQSSAQGQRALARSRSATQRHDAYLRVHQQVQGDPLFRASTSDAESLPITAHKADPLVRGHASQTAAPIRQQDQAAMAGKVAGFVQVDHAVFEQPIEVASGNLHLVGPGVSRLDSQLGAVLLGRESDR